MSLDMQVRFGSDIDAEIRPRMDRIDEMTRALGCQSDPHRAALLNLSTRTITRARNGRGIGQDFVAHVLAVARLHRRRLAASDLKFTPSFHELFEVVVAPPVGASR